MEAFMEYEHIKQLVVYACFGGLVGLGIFSYSYLIYSAISGIVKLVKKLVNNKREKEAAKDVCD